jgi:PST family polysaccharide transporter
MVQQLYSPITNSLYPRITRTRNFSEHKKFLMLGTPLITGCAFLIILLREPIMFVIGGQEFVAGSYVLAMVCPVLIFSYAAVMLGYPVLAAVGKSKQLTFTSMTSAGFHILGLFLLVVSGNFSIEAVCVLRCATEAVLLITRASFSVRILKQCDKNGQLPQGV